MTRLPILLVENNQAAITAFQHTVQTEQLPYDYGVARSATDALKQINLLTQPFAIILIAYDLPNGDGLSLLKALKAQKENDMPVIFMATAGDEAVVVAALQVGAADYLLKDANQRYLLLLPIVIERVLAQQRIVQQLYATEARYRQTFEIRGLPKLIIDPENGRIVDANPAAARFYGETIEMLKTRDVFAINLSPADEIRAKMAEASVSPLKSYELIQWGAGHIPRDVEIFTGLIELNGKKLLYSTITDVTEKRLAWRSLEAANELLERRVAERSAELAKVSDRIEAIFNHSADSLLMIGITADIQQANRAFNELFQIEPNSYIGLSLLIFVQTDDHPVLDRAIADSVRTHESRQIEVRALRADDVIFDVQINIAPVNQSTKAITSLVCIIHDISARKAADQQLRYLASLQENMYDAVIGTDLSYRIQSWNKAAERLYGWSAEEVIGKTRAETLPQTIIGESTAEAGSHLLKTGVWRGEAIQHHRDGTELYVLASVVLHHNEQGVPIGLIAVNRNITERKKAETALAEAYRAQSEMQDYLKALHQISLKLTHVETLDEFYRAVVAQGLARFGFERMGLLLFDAETGGARGTYGTDTDGQVTDENQLYVAPDQIRGVVKQIMNREVQLVYSPTAQLYDGQNPLKIGQNAVAAIWDGELLGWLSIDNAIRYAPISEAQRDIFALYALTVGSLLGRKRAELDLRRVSQRLEIATQSGGFGIWEWDIAHDHLTWDDRMYALYGIRAEDFPGSTAIRQRVVHPDDVVGLEAELAAVIRREKDYDTEFRALWPDGSVHHIKANALLLAAPDGRAERMIGVNIDITELKEAQQVLLNALEKQTELSDLKSQFVSMASHEFRTPLAVILSTTETLSAYRAKLSEAQIEARLDKIKQQVAHMKDIMDDVLQLARLQAGKSLEFKPLLLDIDALCLDIIEEFQSQPGNQDRIIYEGATPLIGAFDTRLMRHMISNLISNGLKYSSADKPILVTLRREPSSIMFIIQDQGIGIPSKDLPRLFEPFNRASNVGTISGTGLGLSIVKQAVEIHGGTITVESQMDVGTTFTVVIPNPLNQNMHDNAAHDSESTFTP